VFAHCRRRHTTQSQKQTHGNASTKTPGLTIVNSIVSTPGAQCLTADLKDFYLNTRLDDCEYMRIPVTQIPQNVIDQNKIASLIVNGHVYIETSGVIYGLIQAGAIANRKLASTLATHGFHQMARTPGLFKHATRPISFSLTVDDFLIAYVGNKENADHLLHLLESNYRIT
jgi:hypothetical protein